MTPFKPGAPTEDYARFHELALTSQDVDPVYPVLSHIGSALNLDRDARLWLTLLHVAYYHLGSALEVFAARPTPGLPPVALLKAPTGTERRAHRTPAKLAAHLAALADAAESAGSLGLWLDGGLAGETSRRARWNIITGRVMRIYGNGRWAAFKSAEMLWKVNGLDLAAPDMGHAHSTGPRHGLGLLFDGLPTGSGAADVARLDQVSDDLCGWLAERGLHAPVEEVETTLCDFHSLARGNYYVGHDIDQMQAQLRRRPSELTTTAMQARSAVFAARYLGEVNGWAGVRKPLRRAYMTGKQLVWWEGREAA